MVIRFPATLLPGLAGGQQQHAGSAAGALEFMAGKPGGGTVLGQVDFGRYFGALAGRIKQGDRAEGGVAGAETAGIVRPASAEGGDDAGTGDDHTVGRARWLG